MRKNENGIMKKSDILVKMKHFFCNTLYQKEDKTYKMKISYSNK